jgi:hypothetical protein
MVGDDVAYGQLGSGGFRAFMSLPERFVRIRTEINGYKKLSKSVHTSTAVPGMIICCAGS